MTSERSQKLDSVETTSATAGAALRPRLAAAPRSDDGRREHDRVSGDERFCETALERLEPELLLSRDSSREDHGCECAQDAGDQRRTRRAVRREVCLDADRRDPVESGSAEELAEPDADPGPRAGGAKRRLNTLDCESRRARAAAQLRAAPMS